MTYITAVVGLVVVIFMASALILSGRISEQEDRRSGEKWDGGAQ